MKIAALQYQYDFPKDFSQYQEKISHLVAHEAKQGTQLLLLPEYAGMEMLSFAPLETLFGLLPRYLELFQSLSQRHRIWICAGTHFVKTSEGVFNRCHLFTPHGKMAHQDKCTLTPYEVNEGILKGGNDLRVFDTEFGKIAIAICYDAEFPPLVKRLVDGGAKLILVPSCTTSVHGFYRVFLSCRARALENQCYVVQSALIGQTDVEMTYGSAAFLGPVDVGFPEDGVLALGKRDMRTSVFATLDFHKLDPVRRSGQTKNLTDAEILAKRHLTFESVDLR
jgi:predicted amidohydrolase